MNLGEMRQAVRDDIDEAQAAFWSDALLNRYINRAHVWVRNVVAQLDEDFLERRSEGTYAGSSRVTTFRDLGLPDETLSFVGVWDITNDNQQGVRLDHISIHQAEDLYGTGDSGTAYGGWRRGTSPAYFITGGEGGARELGYRPIPSAARTLRFVYVRVAPTLKVDRDVPDLPTELHEAIVLRAVVLAKKREQAPVADFESELRRVIETGVLTLDGRHADVDTRVNVTDPEYYAYDL